MPSLLPADFDFKNIIPSWSIQVDSKRITKTFKFNNFKSAFAFMTLCAHYAEEIDHHPDWSNCWNTVNVELSTHSLGGLSELDIQMAQAMDRFSAQT